MDLIQGVKLIPSKLTYILSALLISSLDNTIFKRELNTPIFYCLACVLPADLHITLTFPPFILGTHEGVAAFAEWAPATGLFHRRCGTSGSAGEGKEDGA